VYRALRTVIDSLDQRRAQVYVEALIVEVTTGRAAEFGVQWQAARNVGGGQSVFGGTNFNTGIASGLGTNIINAAVDPSTLGPGLNLGLIKGSIKIPGTGHRDREPAAPRARARGRQRRQRALHAERAHIGQ
jgi:general secretion pathway protein D